jgi:plastocyanin
MRTWYRVVVLSALGLSAVLAAPALATDFTVQIPPGPPVFSPANLVVTAGDRVNWWNRQSLQHTSTSGFDCAGDGLWDTGFLNLNAMSAFVTFNTPGVYLYFCTNHCLFDMTGTITVNPKPVAVQNRTWGAIKALYRTGE